MMRHRPLRAACAAALFATLAMLAPARAVAPAAADAAAAFVGEWKGLSEWANAREWLGLSITPADSGRMLVRMSLPAIRVHDVPIGLARLEGDSLHAGPFAFQWDSTHATLRGLLPAALVPVHEIPVTLTRGDALAHEPRDPIVAPGRDAVWTFHAGAAVWAPLAAGAGLVYIGGDDGVLHALSVRTGQERWRFRAAGRLRAEPTLDASSLYLHADDGMLYRLDAASGHVRWKTRLERDSIVRIPIDQPGSRYDFTASSVRVWGNTLYVGTHDGRMLALAPDDGHVIWQAEVGGAIISAPALADGRVFVGSLDGSVSAWDAGVGERLWRIETGAPVSATPVSDGRVVLASSRSYDLLALDAITGDVQWNRYVWYSWIESTPTLADGIAYLGSSDASRVFALELRSGRSRWETDVHGISWTTPAVTLDRVYVTARYSPSLARHEGSLLALDRESGAVLWRVTNDAPAGAMHRGFASSPIVARGRVVAAALDGTVQAFPEDDAEAEALRRRAGSHRSERSR